MTWLALIGIGAAVGVVVRILALAMPIRWEMVIGLSIFGAILGGILQSVTHTTVFGPNTFYYMGVLLAFLVGAGELLPYALTRREKRV